MVMIWYNPDAEKYEVGFKNEYAIIHAQSPNPDRFQVLYEFDTTEASHGLARKIIANLNLARAFELKPQEIFA